jgi:hypothetical protein
MWYNGSWRRVVDGRGRSVERCAWTYQKQNMVYIILLWYEPSVSVMNMKARDINKKANDVSVINKNANHLRSTSMPMTYDYQQECQCLTTHGRLPDE